MIEILQIPALNDNYIYLLHEPESSLTAAIDPALAEPVLEALDERGWKLSHIFNTHHHSDHVGGNLELKQKTGCIILGMESDRQRIPGIDSTLKDNQIMEWGKTRIKVLSLPGHTSGHGAFWFFEENALFCGDVLFSLGCGRLFEGTAEQMWRSLERIKTLPCETLIYCAHEYTQSNGRFALSLEPDNLDLIDVMKKVNEKRSQELPTVPSKLSQELLTNPFLRAKDAESFAKIRQLKDTFR